MSEFDDVQKQYNETLGKIMDSPVAGRIADEKRRERQKEEELKENERIRQEMEILNGGDSSQTKTPEWRGAHRKGVRSESGEESIMDPQDQALEGFGPILDRDNTDIELAAIAKQIRNAEELVATLKKQKESLLEHAEMQRKKVVALRAEKEEISGKADVVRNTLDREGQSDLSVDVTDLLYKDLGDGVGKLNLGRGTDTGDPKLNKLMSDEHISRNHATLAVTARTDGKIKYGIIDNGSTGGTTLYEQGARDEDSTHKVPVNVPFELMDGDVFSLANHEFKFRIIAGRPVIADYSLEEDSSDEISTREEKTSEDIQTPEVELPAGTINLDEKFDELKARGRSYIEIGRGESTGAINKDIAIPEEKMAVSRIHAAITRNGNQYMIVDRISSNGTYTKKPMLFPRRVSSESRNATVLEDGDLIYLGQHDATKASGNEAVFRFAKIGGKARLVPVS